MGSIESRNSVIRVSSVIKGGTHSARVASTKKQNHCDVSKNSRETLFEIRYNVIIRKQSSPIQRSNGDVNI